MIPGLYDFIVVGVTYGLICLSVTTDHSEEVLIVINPLTGQSVEIDRVTMQNNQDNNSNCQNFIFVIEYGCQFSRLVYIISHIIVNDFIINILTPVIYREEAQLFHL